MNAQSEMFNQEDQISFIEHISYWCKIKIKNHSIQENQVWYIKVENKVIFFLLINMTMLLL